ncbi:MAG: 16S rRNA (cytidine(1402)-2'-O)-methyltransferase [Candidatus Cloacimonetes bacterium]|nr:16S rRNA (cytidine(1402)-2'-O)-methyltransferase [Candidatus Cloacimonadota bacterium]
MKTNSKKGILFIVPTPIGNMSDITLRAIDTLKEVAIIGAEDTRTSGKLLKYHGIDTKMLSYHKFNEMKRVDLFVEKLLKGDDIAIISDAGTPGISDPASKIIAGAIANNIEVITLPGAVAFVPALVSSGLSCEQFHFIGFLPDKSNLKDMILNKIKNIENTLIFYESPHRLFKTIAILKKILGNRKISIAREISKLYETHYRTTFDEVLKKPEDIILKGEFVLIVDGFQPEKVTSEDIINEMKKYIGQGYSGKETVHKVKELFSIPKNRVYKLMLEIDDVDG